MGMYDNLYCRYPLPAEGAEYLSFQTKDTPAQSLDLYEIREDGTLWHQDYDIEDRSDPEAEGIDRLIGMATTVNKRWVPVDLTDTVRFYTFWDDIKNEGWIEFRARFENGKLQDLAIVQDERP